MYLFAFETLEIFGSVVKMTVCGAEDDSFVVRR